MTTHITDEMMRSMLPTVREYCVVILKAGPTRHMDGVQAILWEHGRRNFSLRADGILPIVCPIADGSDVNGVGILTAPAGDAAEIMDRDPGVQAGVFTYQLHPCLSFPGDALPS